MTLLLQKERLYRCEVVIEQMPNNTDYDLRQVLNDGHPWNLLFYE